VVQLTITERFDGFFEWSDFAMALVVLAGLGVAAAPLFDRRLPLSAGIAVVVAGLLLIPATWSQHETANASLNTTLPQAGPRQGAAGRTFGSDAFDNGISSLAIWLERNNTTGVKWNLAVTSAQNASTLIAQHNLPVLALGGFSGRDPTLSAAEFAALVANGDVRYVLTNGSFPRAPTTVPNRSQNSRTPSRSNGGALPGTPDASAAVARGAGAVMAAVQSTCVQVTDRTLPVQFRNQVYDCAGKAAALAAR
jgi:4-amino-4-deoxy-L-arabinose transferase-like glycosyltransferase